MANTEPKTCQVNMGDILFGGKPCGRPLYDGQKCICHSEKEDKDVQLFQKELNKIFEDENADFYDLTRFYFPKTGYKLPREYKKDVCFRWATFSGAINFSQVKFSAQADFSGAMFSRDANFGLATFSKGAVFSGSTVSGEALFINADFLGLADFRWATFSGVAHFGRAKFSGEAIFFQATFSGGTNFGGVTFSEGVDFGCAVFSVETYFWMTTFSGAASFWRATFSDAANFDAEINMEKMFFNPADLTSCTLTQPKKIRFRKVSLANCRFLETDVSHIQFIDVTWGKKPKFLKWFSRNAVYDEVSVDDNWFKWLHSRIKREKESPKPEYTLIAQLYRRLQANYITNYCYAQAGDFYLGEQEMVRKGKGSGWTIWRRWVCTNFVYKCLSYYGESFLLPLVWLAVVLLGFPVYLLREGTDIATYPQALWTNLTFITFNRTAISTSLPLPYQQGIVAIENIVIVVLVTFFVLALRRRYKRKGF